MINIRHVSDVEYDEYVDNALDKAERSKKSKCDLVYARGIIWKSKEVFEWMKEIQI